ncbi:MAG: M1 family metallopeptidase [Flavobacterium sp.]|nr:M1 family metallopeptidase [Candidatus Neoflavobacterium equi]
MRKIILLACCVTTSLWAQKSPNPGYWQQHVDYKMDVAMDVKTFQYSGTQELEYTNNSPDTLRKVFYHLYFNAFQPGSAMDHRLKEISDPDKRMVKSFKRNEQVVKESRISTLKPNEIGFLNVSELKQDGTLLKSQVVGTVLEVTLAQPILPGSKTKFNLKFNGQVPLQVRRSGRNSEEGVALSMTQWYPKMAEFDFEGWHADPYIAREFHGVWGNFDVKLTLDKNYTVGATGYLENKNEIGHGYQDAGVEVKIPKKSKNLTWHFIAPNVHDFAWGADNEFAHDKITGPNGVELHFLYKKDKEYSSRWKDLQPKTADLMQFFNDNIGVYPYKQYSVIQGGDGGMEYAMATLITGDRSLPSLIGVTAHELAHMWFQHILATNESKHFWMDEGFTSFISDLAVSKIMDKKLQEDENPFQSMYNNYYYMVASGKELPQSTHADRFDTNRNYGISAYSKGAIFLTQLGYVIGNDNMMKTLRRYYDEFKFTHPTPNDFKRTAERVSGASLDWYLNDWTKTTNTIDYGIKSVVEATNQTKVTLERIGMMPMPLDVVVVYEDDTYEGFYISNSLMRWNKENPFPAMKRTVLTPWDWAQPTFEFTIDKPKAKIKNIIIDPSQMMADVNKENNVYTKQ